MPKAAMDKAHAYVCVCAFSLQKKTPWVDNCPSKVKWAAQWKEAFPAATLWGTPGTELGMKQAQGEPFLNLAFSNGLRPPPKLHTASIRTGLSFQARDMDDTEKVGFPTTD